MKIIYLNTKAQFQWWNKNTPNEKHKFTCDFQADNYDSKINLNIMATAWRAMRLPDEAIDSYDHIELLEITVEVIEKEI